MKRFKLLLKYCIFPSKHKASSVMYIIPCAPWLKRIVLRCAFIEGRFPPARLIWSKRALNMRAVIIGSIVTFPCSCCKLWKCQTSRLSVAILACVINWTSHCTHTIEVYPSAQRSVGKIGLSINSLALRQSGNPSVLFILCEFMLYLNVYTHIHTREEYLIFCILTKYLFYQIYILGYTVPYV